MKCIFCGAEQAQVIKIITSDNSLHIQDSGANFFVKCLCCKGHGQQYPTAQIAILEWEFILEALHDHDIANGKV